jgi:formate dehydrogenase subunit delta
MSAGDRSATLVMMANQIAAFFASQPRQDAPREIAAHLKAFWTPTMRDALHAFVMHGGEGLTPAAKAGVLALQAAHTPEDDVATAPGDDAG